MTTSRQGDDETLGQAPDERVRALEERVRALEGQLAALESRRGSDLERAASELRRSEGRFRLLVEQMPVMVGVHREGKFVFVNNALTQTLGYRPDELLGMPVVTVVHPEQRALVIERVRRVALAGEVLPYAQERLLRRDGTELLAEVKAMPLPFDGQPSVVVFATDTTERQQLEEHLRQSARMEAVGRLAGGIAHDFNNLLSIMLNAAHFLQQQLPPSSPGRADADQIYAAARRAAELTRQLLTFSRGAEPAAEVLDVNRVLEELERLLRGTLGEAIELRISREQAPCPVKLARANLEQVLVNLTVNARDAMPQGGTLEIETRCVDISPSREASALDPAPGRYVRLRVSDTGTGMTPEVAAQAFEPFFTTKQVGQGTGLGLAITYGVVRKAGGHITLTSAPQQGTTFTLWLPLSQDRPEPQPREGVEVPPPRGSGEVILVVEDEDGVRAMIERILRERGYRVLSARSAAEALPLLEAHPGAIHLLLTDVIMPRTSGPQLARRARELRPGLPVLFLSGYTGNELAQHGVINDSALVRKPFDEQTLLDHVNRALVQKLT